MGRTTDYPDTWNSRAGKQTCGGEFGPCDACLNGKDAVATAEAEYYTDTAKADTAGPETPSMDRLLWRADQVEVIELILSYRNTADDATKLRQIRTVID